MIYLDTSYLVRIFVRQPGSDQVNAWMIGKSHFVCSMHGKLELEAALKRLEQSDDITSRGYKQAIRQIRHDESTGMITWLPVTADIVSQACETVGRLDKRTFLRAADALHLASAAEAGCTEIYSHDRHLLAAASAFGLEGIDILS